MHPWCVHRRQETTCARVHPLTLCSPACGCSLPTIVDPPAPPPPHRNLQDCNLYQLMKDRERPFPEARIRAWCHQVFQGEALEGGEGWLVGGHRGTMGGSENGDGSWGGSEVGGGSWGGSGELGMYGAGWAGNCDVARREPRGARPAQLREGGTEQQGTLRAVQSSAGCGSCCGQWYESAASRVWTEAWRSAQLAAAAGLAYIHSRGYFHRDMKPGGRLGGSVGAGCKCRPTTV